VLGWGGFGGGPFSCKRTSYLSSHFFGLSPKGVAAPGPLSPPFSRKSKCLPLLTPMRLASDPLGSKLQVIRMCCWVLGVWPNLLGWWGASVGINPGHNALRFRLWDFVGKDPGILVCSGLDELVSWVGVIGRAEAEVRGRVFFSFFVGSQGKWPRRRSPSEGNDGRRGGMSQFLATFVICHA